MEVVSSPIARIIMVGVSHFIVVFSLFDVVLPVFGVVGVAMDDYTPVGEVSGYLNRMVVVGV